MLGWCALRYFNANTASCGDGGSAEFHILILSSANQARLYPVRSLSACGSILMHSHNEEGGFPPPVACHRLHSGPLTSRAKVWEA